MADVGFAANLESSPARVRDPTVFFGLPFFKQSVADGTRKWDINGSLRVHMSNLRFPKSEFFAPEPMRVNGDTRPRRNFAFQSFYIVHIPVPVSVGWRRINIRFRYGLQYADIMALIRFMEAAGTLIFVFEGWGN
jgi:hypothetical protein